MPFQHLTHLVEPKPYFHALELLDWFTQLLWDAQHGPMDRRIPPDAVETIKTILIESHSAEGWAVPMMKIDHFNYYYDNLPNKTWQVCQADQCHISWQQRVSMFSFRNAFKTDERLEERPNTISEWEAAKICTH